MLAKPTFLRKFRHKPTGVTVTLFDDWAAASRLEHNRPQYPLAYVLRDNGKVVFRGRDYGCSPMHAIDSLDSLAGLLGFLTLKPGDTDRDYFDNYTPRQLEWTGGGNADSLRFWVFDHEERR